ncbi:N-acetyl-gamma-glutamyl-phosphate reductase [Virgibacillus halodenitrificans]|uniref:N-acetyl-gamma-glutamyl-phosphate reductase n=1 Tax=Virgibacillus halodenitrificans TaxID=1482 RepID=UPI0009ECA53C
MVKRAAIIGGTGYGAAELIRLIHLHKYLEVSKIISHSHYGEYIATHYPHMHTYMDLKMEALDVRVLANEVDIIFFATPAGIAKELIPQLEGNHVQCIDLSGDLRLPNRDLYQKWYGQLGAPQEMLDKAVYGLTEVFPNQIKDAEVVSNPGCFPTASLLGLTPSIKEKIIDTQSIIIDGKTGVSGAGGSPSKMTHFSETNENIQPYKIGKHQHIPEIEHYLSITAGESINATFTTHLIPMTRGLLCTIYGRLTKNITTKEIIHLYQDFYANHPFIRVLEEDQTPTTKNVYGSNFCDISIHVDERTNQLVIVSAIDNLVKGAAGQAIQNANLMNDWKEEEGLAQLPIYP